MTAGSSLALGDPVLDREHAELERLIDGLRQSGPAQVPAALDALKAHAAQHFDREDAELRKLGGANATCHLDEHAAVLRSLDDVRAALGQPSPAAGMVPRLVAELVRWLPEHVQVMDAGIAAVRTKERLGGAPVLVSRRVPPGGS